jgi:hypothetical protein
LGADTVEDIVNILRRAGYCIRDCENLGIDPEN